MHTKSVDIISAMFALLLQAGELERVEQEIIVSLQGMGLSLVNNEIMKEVAYMGIMRYSQLSLTAQHVQIYVLLTCGHCDV